MISLQCEAEVRSQTRQASAFRRVLQLASIGSLSNAAWRIQYTIYINTTQTNMAEQTNGDASVNPDVEMKEDSAPEVQLP
jgi:hypothetical protein